MEIIIGATAISLNVLLLMIVALLAAITLRLWREPAPPDTPPPAGRSTLRSFGRKPAEKRRPFAISDERAAELEREEAERPGRS